MISFEIKHLYHIDAPIEKVYQAISSIEGLQNWWTIQTKGNSVLGGQIQFDFGDFEGPLMQVVALETKKKVQWRCIKEEDLWYNHGFSFDLDHNENKTRLRFTHSNWEETNDFYAHCNFSWGRYLESLRQYCQHGVGQAFGSKNYMK